MTSQSLDLKKLKVSLKSDARALCIPPGAADTFITETLKSVSASLKHKKIITDADLKRAIAKELKKYHQDFAYVYENRDRII